MLCFFKSFFIGYFKSCQWYYRRRNKHGNHKAIHFYISKINTFAQVYPRSAKLYTKQEPSDKFILILEGRAMVTIGKVVYFLIGSPLHIYIKKFLIIIIVKLPTALNKRDKTLLILTIVHAKNSNSLFQKWQKIVKLALCTMMDPIIVNRIFRRTSLLIVSRRS